MSQNSDFRKLTRLREARRRLDRRITLLEKKLAGRKGWWGGCSMQRKRQ